jgi:crossover junction endodeoxyribonuclease RuvC
MRILGIDPGIGILGFGVIEGDSASPRLVDAGVIRTQVKAPDAERLVAIYEGLQEIFGAAQPEAVSIEKLFFARNVTTAMSVSQARGIVLLVAQQHEVPIFEYTPLQIKMALTGYGKADKKQVQEMVRLTLRLTVTPKPDDCADAIAAALTHSTQARGVY